MPFILDASVALCWILPGQGNLASTEILRRTKREGAIVPALWHSEIANQLGRKLSHGVLLEDDVTFALDLIDDLDLITDSFTRGSAAEILPHMLRHTLTAYDATYLVLAVRNSMSLATFNKELIAASNRAGVQLIR